MKIKFNIFAQKHDTGFWFLPVEALDGPKSCIYLIKNLKHVTDFIPQNMEMSWKKIGI